MKSSVRKIQTAQPHCTIYEDARDVPLLEVSLIITELSPRVIG